MIANSARESPAWIPRPTKNAADSALWRQVARRIASTNLDLSPTSVGYIVSYKTLKSGEVTLNGGSLQFADLAALTVDLVDPGADPSTGANDGLIRLGELQAGRNLVTSTTVDDPRASEIVLTVAPQAAVTSSGARPFVFNNPGIVFNWANLAAPSGVLTDPVSGGDGGLLMQFLSSRLFLGCHWLLASAA